MQASVCLQVGWEHWQNVGLGWGRGFGGTATAKNWEEGVLEVERKPGSHRVCLRDREGKQLLVHSWAAWAALEDAAAVTGYVFETVWTHPKRDG